MTSMISEDAIKGSPLWGHMVGMLKKIVQERPANGLDAISRDSRDDAGAANDMSSARVAAQLHTDCAANFCDVLVPPKMRRPMFEDPENEDEMNGGDAGGDGGGEGEGGEEVPGDLVDVVGQQRVFNSLGEGVTPGEAFRIAVGIKRLLEKEPLAKVRFWGKILCGGGGGSYIIAEGSVDEGRLNVNEEEEGGEEEEFDEEADDRTRYIDAVSRVFNAHVARSAPRPLPEDPSNSRGTNGFRYYVAAAQDVTAWTLLPDLKPATLAAARCVRQQFTGNLNAEVRCIPPFPGLEKDFLRAQIARITATCSIAPKDVFSTEGAIPEDDSEEQQNDNSRGNNRDASGAADSKKKGKRPVAPLIRAYEELPPLVAQETPDEEDAEAVANVAMWFYGYKNDELLNEGNWVHIAPTLLSSGRYAAEPATVIAERAAAESAAAAGGDGNMENGEDAEEPEDELNLFGTGLNNRDDADPSSGKGGINRFREMIHPFLSPLSYDKPINFQAHSKAALPAWSFRKAFRNPSSRNNTYIAKSLLWPGAYTYAHCTQNVPGAEYQTVYIGTGQKNEDTTLYAPPLPPLPMMEFEEGGIVTQRDATADDELQYAPMPPTPPPASEAGDMEADDENSQEDEE